MELRLSVFHSYHAVFHPGQFIGTAVLPRYFQSLLTSTKALSTTWNFPDSVIKRALLKLFQFEDCVSKPRLKDLLFYVLRCFALHGVDLEGLICLLKTRTGQAATQG